VQSVEFAENKKPFPKTSLFFLLILQFDISPDFLSCRNIIQSPVIYPYSPTPPDFPISFSLSLLHSIPSSLLPLVVFITSLVKHSSNHWIIQLCFWCDPSAFRTLCCYDSRVQSDLNSFGRSADSRMVELT